MKHDKNHYNSIVTSDKTYFFHYQLTFPVSGIDFFMILATFAIGRNRS